MPHSRTLLLSGLLALWASVAAAQPLVVLVDRAADLPFADFEADEVKSGIHLLLSQALAARLGRPLALKAVPRKRLGPMLTSGQADLACALMPEWLPDAVSWSQPFLPHAGVVITPATSPRPASLADLAGQPIGTIKGYSYRELEQALGSRLVRADAPNARTTLRMLELGRMQHASVNLQYLEYQRKLGLFTLALHPYLSTGAYETRCALSKRSGVSLEELDKHITAMRNDGTLKRMLDQFRN